MGKEEIPEELYQNLTRKILFCSRFAQKTFELKYVVNQKSKKAKKVCKVMGFKEGKFYVTNEENKPDAPLSIPWDMAKNI